MISIELDGGCVILFPPDFDDRSVEEMTDRGYVSSVTVVTPQGRYILCLITPIRLQQELLDMTRIGFPFVAEPGMVVVTEVTMDIVRKTVVQLLGQQFFSCLLPVQTDVPA